VRRRAADKIVEPAIAATIVSAWREAQLRVVRMTGNFDLLDAEHVRAVEQGRRSADRVVIEIESDAAVARVSPGLPVIPAADRARVIAALRVVDLVVIVPHASPDAIRIDGDPSASLAARVRRSHGH
jgi:bifunctional ADP-heptose synthase (sugar kinase/adenylyltransferase)